MLIFGKQRRFVFKVICLIVLLNIGMFFAFRIWIFGRHETMHPIEKELLQNNSQTIGDVDVQALKSMQSPYRVSLEIRENVDYLLTPAILIQESISEGQIILYPND